MSIKLINLIIVEFVLHYSSIYDILFSERIHFIRRFWRKWRKLIRKWIKRFSSFWLKGLRIDLSIAMDFLFWFSLIQKIVINFHNSNVLNHKMFDSDSSFHLLFKFIVQILLIRDYKYEILYWIGICFSY